MFIFSLDKLLSQITHLLEKEDLILNDVNLKIDSLKLIFQSILESKLYLSTNNINLDKQNFQFRNNSIPPLPQYKFNKIEEITFKRSNGTEVKIGGDILPPFWILENHNSPIINPNPPKVAIDVFDMKISLPKPIKDAYKEVLEDPPSWAELAEKNKADLITLHFTSTDPGMKDTSVSQSVKLLDEVLQRVKCPIIIGGSGNKKKDVELFEGCAAATQGERLMLSSADKLTWDRVVPIAKKYDHNVLLWAQLDVNDQNKLVEDALRIGMPRNRIVLDPTCATLGYGLEYSFSIYQRIRLAGLKNETNFCFPMSGGTTNAWGAREAWMKELLHMPANGGDRDLRGPLWEIITALSLALCGLNLAMMLHPTAARIFKSIIQDLFSPLSLKFPNYLNWVTMNN